MTLQFGAEEKPTMSKEPPVLNAYRTDDGAIMVWCPYDRAWHSHGGCGNKCPPRRSLKTIFQGTPCQCPPGTGDGHRWSHCSKRTSPYQETGYVLREVGRFTKDVEKRRGF
jgi:hypothetical protein